MLQDILRTIGAACILTGAFLFFSDTDEAVEKSDATKQELQSQLATLQTKLADTQKELANLQTATSVAEKSSAEVEDVSDDEELETKPLVKSVFTIQPGTDSSTVVQLLVRQGIINDKTDFETYLATNELSGKIQIGEYDLDSSMTIETIAKIITKAK